MASSGRSFEGQIWKLGEAKGRGLMEKGQSLNWEGSGGQIWNIGEGKGAWFNGKGAWPKVGGV